MKKYLIAHSCPRGHNVAQVAITAKNQILARKIFNIRYEERSFILITEVK
jgi:hypothetical protein